MQQPYNQSSFRTPLPSISPTQEQRDRQARDIYRFFASQEAQGLIFTYNDMRAIYPRSVYWYARYRWSWFIKIVARGRQHTFRCQGLIKYPEEYFVLAHRPRQAPFFAHFAEAMRIAKARDQGQDPASTITEPEPLEIADIRKDEEYYQEGDDEVPEEEQGQGETIEEEQSSETSVSQEPAPSMSLVTREDPTAHDEDAVERYSVDTSVTIWERIVAMLGFSGKDHEIEQLRIELTGRMQALEGQLQGVITTLSGLQSDVRDQARLFTQALTQEMSSRVEGLTREIQQSQHSSLQTDLSQQIEQAKKDLVIAIERIPISVDLVSIRRDMQTNTEQIQQRLSEALQQPSASSTEVIQVKQDVARLTGMLEAFAENLKLLVPSATNGTEQSIHERIRLYLDQVHHALGTLERAHALWLQEHIHQLQDLEQKEQEAYKGRQERIQSIFVHISPQPQDGEKTQEKMSQEAEDQESSPPEQAEDGDKPGEETSQEDHTLPEH